MWIFLLIFFQFELSEVLEHPIIFQSSKNNIQEFASQGDIGFCSSPSTFYVFVKSIEIWTVSFCDQRTLNKSCPGNLTALFGDPPMTYRVMGVIHPRHYSDIRRKLLGGFEIFNMSAPRRAMLIAIIYTLFAETANVSYLSYHLLVCYDSYV